MLQINSRSKINMKIRNLTEEEKDKLIDLYKNTNQLPEELRDIVRRGFAIENGVAEESILFISMNPSYSSKNGAWNNGTVAGKNAVYDIPDLKTTKNSNEDTNSFFQEINRFYGDLKVKGIPLAHHDLLFIRETNQDTVLYWKEKLDKYKNTFFDDQLKISKTIIEESNPKLIVVLNAGARHLFEEMFGQRNPNIFNDILGAYMYNLNNERTTPVLFSGMLSGQRALDLGSKESLKWHIEHILKNIS